MPIKINSHIFAQENISKTDNKACNNDNLHSKIKHIRNVPEHFINKFTKDAYVFCKKRGDSYKSIISHLLETQKTSDSNTLEAELKLYQKTEEYIKTHPNSGRNRAIRSLHKLCSKHINETNPISDEAQAKLQLYKIIEGVTTTQKVDFNIQKMPDGSKLLADKPRALQLLNELQKPITHEKIIEDELNKAKIDGNSIRNKAGLNKNEIESIQWYTSIGFQYINAALRSGEQLTSFIKEHGENIMIGLNKLSSFTGEVYRSLAVDNLSSLAEKLTPGQLVTDKGFISTSSNSTFAKTFRGGKGTVIYSIYDVTTGKNIADYTQLKQAEVLLLPNYHMRVVATKLTEKNLYVVLESTNKFHKGESVCDIASGNILGISINNEKTTVNKEIKI
ncbi:membrane-targeted effector domain-containing toxin [Symbiopectobacterium purcellii]|uniref:membrane-targeted effector domain-containing toxin n=1 Tax=Symbiopectobacterium purcellii TaxID=2871826 RepID=UPI003F864C04